MTDPTVGDSGLPEFNLNIRSERVEAKPRRLYAPDRRTPLQKFVEALDDPDYDPDNPPAPRGLMWSQEAVDDLRLLWKGIDEQEEQEADAQD